MYKVFIVEDETGIAESVKKLLEMWGMECACAEDFRNVMKEFAEFSPHMVLLDISLPCFNGYYWCEEIRKVSKVPIIFLSSAADNMNIVMAMNMGADDFIAKPFDANVLAAKVQAMLRRTYDFGESVTVLEHRGALLDTGSGKLVFGDEQIDLTRNEYRILLTLMQNKGKVVSREKLMEVLWEDGSFVDDNTLTVNINRLRKKLDGAGLTGFITTKVKVGYLLASD